MTAGGFSRGHPGTRQDGPQGARTGAFRHETSLLLGPLLGNAVQKLSDAVEQGERWAIELVVSYSLPKPRPVDADEVQEIEDRIAELEELARSRQ